VKIFSRIKKGFSAIPERTQLVLLSFVVGLGCGFAAVLLKTLIKWIHHGLTFWFTKPSDAYLYLIYPGIGMLLSFLFVRFFVKEDISHGVTKVLLSISRNESRIKPHNTWTSIMASSVTIGFGGSVGAEAPIVYTGAAIGSNVGRSMGMSYKNMTILLGCGAAGAVAGIFKAPLAGVLFTLEILLFNISMTSILPLLISAITALFLLVPIIK
jgi:CIC family chloride channel protein